MTTNAHDNMSRRNPNQRLKSNTTVRRKETKIPTVRAPGQHEHEVTALVVIDAVFKIGAKTSHPAMCPHRGDPRERLAEERVDGRAS